MKCVRCNVSMLFEHKCLSFGLYLMLLLLCQGMQTSDLMIFVDSYILLSYTCFRLHHEIKHFHEAMSPTQSEISARESLLKRITDVVNKLWSGAKVVNFSCRFNSFKATTFTVCAGGCNYEYILLQKYSGMGMSTLLGYVSTRVVREISYKMVYFG